MSEEEKMKIAKGVVMKESALSLQFKCESLEEMFQEQNSAMAAIRTLAEDSSNRLNEALKGHLAKDEQIAQLKQKVIKKDEVLMRLETNIKELALERDRLRLERATKSKADLPNQTGEMGKKLIQMKKENKGLEEKLQESRDKIESDQTRINDILVKMTDLQKIMDAKDLKLKELENKHKNKAVLMKRLVTEMQKLYEKTFKRSSLNAQKSHDLEEQMAGTSKHIEEISGKMGTLESELQETKAKLQESEYKMERLLEEETKCKNILGLANNETSISQKVQQLQKRLKIAKQEKRALEHCQENLVRDLKVQEIEMGRLQTSLDEMTWNYVKTIVSPREKTQSSESQYSDTYSMDRLPEVNAGKNSQIATNHLKVTDPKSRISTLELRLDNNLSVWRSPSRVAQSSQPSSAGTQEMFCVLCRTESSGTGNHRNACQFHWLPYQGRQWRCCSNRLTSRRGCVQTTHFFVMNLGNRYILSNGKKSIEL